MNKKITTAMLIAAMAMSVMACNGKSVETQTPTSEFLPTTETTATTDVPDIDSSNFIMLLTIIKSLT